MSNSAEVIHQLRCLVLLKMEITSNKWALNAVWLISCISLVKQSQSWLETHECSNWVIQREFNWYGTVLQTIWKRKEGNCRTQKCRELEGKGSLTEAVIFYRWLQPARVTLQAVGITLISRPFFSVISNVLPIG